MKVELLKEYDKGNGFILPVGKVIGVTNELGADLIANGEAKETDKLYTDRTAIIENENQSKSKTKK